MEPIYEPGGLTHPTLQEFAMIAAWIATLAETIDDLEDLLIALPRQEPLMPNFRTPWPWEFDTMAVALAVVKTHRTEVVQPWRSCWPPGWARTRARTGLAAHAGRSLAGATRDLVGGHPGVDPHLRHHRGESPRQARARRSPCPGLSGCCKTVAGVA